MGQVLSTVASTVAYPFRAAFNASFGTNPNRDVNITNSNIQEFNSQFADFEEKCNFLINQLFNNVNSSIKTFNANIIFPYSQLLADNLINHGTADQTGEFILERKRLMQILDNIMLLYSTNLIGYVPNNSDNFKTYFLASYATISNNLQNISTSYQEIQPFLNTNNDLGPDEYTIAINNHFNQQFLRANSIIQYLNLLSQMLNRFIIRLDQEIAAFRGENRGLLGNTYDYTVGFFSWLARSGYTYRGTANFYTYYRNNNIRTLLNRVNNKINSFNTAIQTLARIRRNNDKINCHVLGNITDKFEISFYLNENDISTISINLGDYTITNYTVLCNDINVKISEALNASELTNDVKFNITYYENDDERIRNHIVIMCNRRFTMNKESSIMRILGWNDFVNVNSANQLADNGDKIGNFTMSPRKIYTNEIGNIINYSSRHNALITSIQSFDTAMDIQRTQEAN